MLVPPWRVGTPSLGKSWICHWPWPYTDFLPLTACNECVNEYFVSQSSTWHFLQQYLISWHPGQIQPPVEQSLQFYPWKVQVEMTLWNFELVMVFRSWVFLLSWPVQKRVHIFLKVFVEKLTDACPMTYSCISFCHGSSFLSKMRDILTFSTHLQFVGLHLFIYRNINSQK